MTQDTWGFNNDTAQEILIGASGRIVYNGCIQRNDPYGGYNCEFVIEGSQIGRLTRIHIHFARRGTRVSVVRIYPHGIGPNLEGTNIFVTDTPRPIQRIIYEYLAGAGFENHRTMFTHLFEAIAVVRNGDLGGSQELP